MKCADVNERYRLLSVHGKILHLDIEKPGIATWLSRCFFHFSVIFFHVDSCESYATLDTDERQKSGFISDIKRKSLTNPPTVKSRFKLVRLVMCVRFRCKAVSG